MQLTTIEYARAYGERIRARFIAVLSPDRKCGGPAGVVVGSWYSPESLTVGSKGPGANPGNIYTLRRVDCARDRARKKMHSGAGVGHIAYICRNTRNSAGATRAPRTALICPVGQTSAGVSSRREERESVISEMRRLIII